MTETLHRLTQDVFSQPFRATVTEIINRIIRHYYASG
jgi:hypothetical protein